MASVRLGRATRQQIRKAALKAYDIAVVEPKVDNEVIETIWRGIVEHPAHIAFQTFVDTHGENFGELTERGTRPTLSSYIELKYGANQDELFELPTERKSWLTRSYNRHSVNLDNLHLTEVQRQVVRDKIRAMAQKRSENRDQRRSYERQITALLESCNTLKQLLDAQPSMKEFVPDEMLRELHKKVTRESQARERREIAQVDGDLINRVVLTSKLVA